MATPMELSQRKDAVYSERYAKLRFPSITPGSLYKVQTGDMVVFNGHGTGVGRVLSRVDAAGYDGIGPIKGYLCVATLGTTFTFCHVIWVNPCDVTYIAKCPTKFMAGFFGPDVKLNHMPVSSASPNGDDNL